MDKHDPTFLKVLKAVGRTLGMIFASLATVLTSLGSSGATPGIRTEHDLPPQRDEYRP
jgi:hypothetical protein